MYLYANKTVFLISISMLHLFIVLPIDPGSIGFIDYMYQPVHKQDIREQMDLAIAADELKIDKDTLDLCLKLSSGDRISTARQILKHCTAYDEIILNEHSWQSIDKEIISKICSKCSFRKFILFGS